MKRVLNWVKNLGVGILLLLVILSIVSKYKNSNYILGFAPMKVLSGSMEPKLKIGDLIIVKNVDPSTIIEGDVITYKMDNRTYVTHRVVEVFNENNILYKTKGDANNIEDKDLVLDKELIGRLIFRIPKLGLLMDVATRPFGFVLLFVTPIIILISKEVLNYSKS